MNAYNSYVRREKEKERAQMEKQRMEAIENCKRNIVRNWADFRQALANHEFAYNDLDRALHTIFLQVFDDFFRNGYAYSEKRISDILHVDNHVVRAARIKVGDSAPDYNRFIPDADYIEEDNRFSPPRVEWLYLAFAQACGSLPGGLSVAEECALKECRALSGEHFALCDFKANEKFANDLVIDLTIAKGKSISELENQFNARANQILYSEKPQTVVRKELEKCNVEFFMNVYAKLLADQIFLPVDSADKSVMYAPFQCMAQYILSKGYSGIVYASTVYPAGNNIVLFDKTAAHPCGTIRHIDIP